jgi:ABC-type uncharacterized transport system permease subunit
VTITQLPGTGSAVLAQKDRAGVAHALQALFGHRKHADLVHRAKAVLDGAHQAEAAVRVALKVQHRVHHVLQHARAGQRALLGHMADQHHQVPLALAARVRCAAHSRTCATEPGALVSWSEYTVWIESITATSGFVASSVCQDLFELDLGQHLHLLSPAPGGASAARPARRFPRR